MTATTRLSCHLQAFIAFVGDIGVNFCRLLRFAGPALLRHCCAAQLGRQGSLLDFVRQALPPVEPESKDKLIIM